MTAPLVADPVQDKLLEIIAAKTKTRKRSAKPAAELVCRVPKTRCPVSAAVSAIIILLGGSLVWLFGFNGVHVGRCGRRRRFAGRLFIY